MTTNRWPRHQRSSPSLDSATRSSVTRNSPIRWRCCVRSVQTPHSERRSANRELSVKLSRLYCFRPYRAICERSSTTSTTLLGRFRCLGQFFRTVCRLTLRLSTVCHGLSSSSSQQLFVLALVSRRRSISVFIFLTRGLLLLLLLSEHACWGSVTHAIVCQYGYVLSWCHRWVSVSFTSLRPSDWAADDCVEHESCALWARLLIV